MRGPSSSCFCCKTPRTKDRGLAVLKYAVLAIVLYSRWSTWTPFSPPTRTSVPSPPPCFTTTPFSPPTVVSFRRPACDAPQPFSQANGAAKDSTRRTSPSTFFPIVNISCPFIQDIASVAGRLSDSRSSVKPRGFPCPDHDHDNAAGQRQAAHTVRNWNGLLLFGVDLKAGEVDNPLTLARANPSCLALSPSPSSDSASSRCRALGIRRPMVVL